MSLLGNEARQLAPEPLALLAFAAGAEYMLYQSNAQKPREKRGKKLNNFGPGNQQGLKSSLPGIFDAFKEGTAGVGVHEGLMNSGRDTSAVFLLPSLKSK